MMSRTLEHFPSIAEAAYTRWAAKQPTAMALWQDLPEEMQDMWSHMATAVLSVHAERNPAIEVLMERHGISLSYRTSEESDDLIWIASTLDAEGNPCRLEADSATKAVEDMALAMFIRGEVADDDDADDYDELCAAEIEELMSDEDDGLTPEQRAQAERANKYVGETTFSLLNQLCSNAGKLHHQQPSTTATFLVVDDDRELQFFVERLRSAIFGLPNTQVLYVQAAKLSETRGQGLTLAGVVRFRDTDISAYENELMNALRITATCIHPANAHDIEGIKQLIYKL